MQALATRLLQTIDSKREANAQTMENNGIIAGSALKIENLGPFETAIK